MTGGPPPGSPTLSICIPTHHGRRDTLAALLASIVAQVDPRAAPAVEVVISDNASQDGSQEAVTELAAAHPGLARYIRHAADLGPAANLLSAVEAATGRWCWTMSSDDILEAGAVTRVLGLLGTDGPPVPGVLVGKANYDRSMTVLADQGDPAFAPPRRRLTVRHGCAEVLLAECGLYASLWSVMVVRRDVWLRAVDALGRDDLIARTAFPSLEVLAWAAAHDPSWIVCPAKMVRVRLGNASLSVDHALGTSEIALRLIGDMSRLWTRRLGPHHPVARALLRRAYRTFAAPAALAGHDRGGGRRRDRLRRVVARARLFYALPEFWRDGAAVLVEHARRTLGPPSTPPLPSRLRRAAVTAAAPPPGEVGVSDGFAIEVNVTNLTPWPLSAKPPHRILLGYQWLAGDGLVTFQSAGRPLPRAIPVTGHGRVRLDVVAPAEPGDYTLQVAVAQEGIGWFNEDAPEPVLRRTVRAVRFGWDDRPVPLGRPAPEPPTGATGATGAPTPRGGGRRARPPGSSDSRRG